MGHLRSAVHPRPGRDPQPPRAFTITWPVGGEPRGRVVVVVRRLGVVVVEVGPPGSVVEVVVVEGGGKTGSRSKHAVRSAVAGDPTHAHPAGPIQ